MNIYEMKKKIYELENLLLKQNEVMVNYHIDINNMKKTFFIIAKTLSDIEQNHVSDIAKDKISVVFNAMISAINATDIESAFPLDDILDGYLILKNNNDFACDCPNCRNDF